MNKIFTLFISILLFTSIGSVKVNAQGCNCWPDRDTSFHYVPFSYCTSECFAMTSPYYRCDDACTLPIILPFTFCFWGQNSDTVFINANGNLTFGRYGNHFTSYVPDTFPNPHSVVPPMIAPFWGDVDMTGGSGGSDVVLYKITPHYMIVQWDSVGYYGAHRDKLNSFECIISDGTDPIIPKGNNVEFCYRTMQWTTGDASGGSHGFGGDPTVVGANQGDGVRFIQLGLFDSPGFSYFGQFPPAPNYDQVGWLTNKSFFFNLCGGTVAPLISGISPCDTFKVCEGDTLFVPFYFFSPIQGDSVYSNLLPPVAPGVSVTLNHPGFTDSMIVRIIGSALNVGFNTINVYGYDNAHPHDTTYSSFVIEVAAAPRIRMTISKDTLCVGDSAILTATGGTNYIWSPGGATTTSVKVGPLTTTFYTVGVSNAGLCTKDTSVKIYVYPVVGPPATTANPLCLGDSTFFTATAATATTYDWNFGDPASGVHDSSKHQNPGHMFTSVGTFTVTLKMNNGTPCGARDTTFEVTILATPSPVITGPDSVCVGGNVTLNVTGGTTYQWFPGGATSTSVGFAPAGTETITVTAFNGSCSAMKSFTLTVVPDNSANIMTSKDSVCFGDSVTLEGHTGLKYRWSPGGATTANVHLTNFTTTTTYTLYTYAGSCVDSTTKTIPVIPKLTGNATSNLDSICPGTSINLSVTSSGGGSASTYVWSPGGGTSSTFSVTPDSTTTYTVTINSFCGSIQKTVKVTMVPLPTPAINGTPWKCRGVRDTLTVSNGNGPATYIWSNGKTTTTIYTGLIDADSVITVTAFNKLGCPSTTTFPITLRLPDTLTIPPPPVFCAGQNVCFSANANGSPGPSSYSWSNGETTSTICQKVDSATAFSVTVSNGCKSTRSIVVIPDQPNMNACCSQTISIVNDTVTPSVIYLSDSGNSVYYSWAPNVICLNPPLCSKVKPSPTPSVTTTYAVTGTDADSCKLTQYIVITVDVPCFNLAIPNVFTPGNGGTLGLDKVFYIDTRNISGWSLTIFDRWGKTVFSTTDQYKYWDGTTGSGPAPAGVYYYVISGTCQNTTYKRDGFVQLIR